MKNHTKIVAALLALALCLAILSFEIYAAFESDHDCRGVDCPVCSILFVCEKVIGGLALVTACVSLLSGLLSGIALPSTEKLRMGGKTPVQLKIEMIN